MNRNAFVGLLGSNGSGKTTLLRTILGILKPLAGTIEFSSVSGSPPVIGYVPQRESLDTIFLFSAREVVRMGLAGELRAGRPLKQEHHDRVEQALDKTGANTFAQRRFSQLSGGQMQRVLIARALVANPDLLILDEPTAGIDPAASQTICEVLQHLHQQDGKTIIMVNHELQHVRELATEIVWLRDGQIRQGTVEEMLSREHLEELLQLKFK